MSDYLHATVCSIDRDNVLSPFGDPHVHLLHNSKWTFDGRVLHYPLVITVLPGTWHLVMAMGYGPYTQDAGVVDLGVHTIPDGAAGLSVDTGITITFPRRDVTIMRPAAELEPARKALSNGFKALSGR